MTAELSNDDSEPGKVDTCTSDACTRSGIFALALSVALVLLVQSWNRRP
jgi:hypothetical protein